MDEQGTDITALIPSLRRYAKALLGNTFEADDLVQECLARALAQGKSLGKVRNLRAYLFTILHNLHVDRLVRKRTRGETVPLENVEARLSRPATQLRRLEVRDLSWAIDQLSEEQRQVVLLVGLEGLNYKETATVLGIPIGTVMSRLSRGREELRRRMQSQSTSAVRRWRNEQ